MKLPFRLCWWLIRTWGTQEYKIVKARTAGGARDIHDLVAGPFDSEEDAARSLEFWRRVAPGKYQSLYR